MELNRWIRRVCAPAIFAFALAACNGGGEASSATASGQTAASDVPSGGNSGSGTAAPAAKTGSVVLSWESPKSNKDGTPLTNLAGFRVYYGQNPNAPDQNVATGALVTDVMIEDLPSGTWYFFVVAINTEGVASEPSSTASGTISG